MGKYIDLLCTHCHYKVFAAISGGGFYFNSSSYICPMINFIDDLNKKLEVIHKGGGEKAAAKQNGAPNILLTGTANYIQRMV